MKKLFAILLSIIICISTFPLGAVSVAAEVFEAHEETLPINAIAINSVWELSMICNEYPADGYYYLTTNLDMGRDVAENGDFYDNGMGWTPIGTKSTPFTGTFNGCGFTIKNITVNRSTDYVGLFGYLSGAHVFDLNLESANITASNYVGGISGGAENSEIYNLQVKDCTVRGSSNIGGLIGYGSKTSVNNSSMILGSVNSSSNYCGGIGGRFINMADTGAYNCTNSANVNGISNVGGCFGTLTGANAVIDNCRNIGSVNGSSTYVAGIVGDATSSNVQNCVNEGAIVSNDALNANYVGGVVGKCNNVIECINKGNIRALLVDYSYENGQQVNSYVGGVVGEAVNVSTSYNTGDMFTSGGRYTYRTAVSTPTGGYITTKTNNYYTYPGGIAGNATSVEKCYNTGSITSDDSSRAAIVYGKQTVRLTNCYSDANDIPLVSYSGNTVINCYNTNGTIASSGTAVNSYYYNSSESGIGGLRTKRQLRAAITYVDWDFENVWTFEGNDDYLYPELIDLPSEYVKSITDVSLTSLPEKLTYLEGKDIIDISTLKLKVYYDNDTNEEINVTEDMLSGFDNSVVGIQTIRVTYQGHYDEFSVTVLAKSVVSIGLVNLPNKLTYLEQKDELDVSGAQIEIVYNNDSIELKNVTTDMISGFDNSITGTQTLTVIYLGKEVNFNVEIIPKCVTQIEICNLPNKLNYNEGDTLDLSGGTITVSYNNDTSSIIDMSECEVSVDDFTVYGSQIITLNFGGFVVSFDVFVDHSYSQIMAYDNTNHWYECVCGDVINVQEHSFDNGCDTSCNVCSYIRITTHDYVADCDQFCNICGQFRVAPIGHTYDNDCDSKCNVCNTTRNVNDHIYDGVCDAECNECGLIREADIHKIINYTLVNASNYPFSLNNGVYYSTNHLDNSSATATIIIDRSSTIKIDYYTATEQTYDKLIIKHNNSTLITASGASSWQSVNVNALAGDIIYITYTKDGSVSTNGDTVYFKIDSSTGMSPAEDFEPTCEEAVICDVCGIIVKEALGHDIVNHDSQMPTCTGIGWSAYQSCTRCDYTTYVEIAASGHSEGETVIENLVKPDCVTYGSYDEVVYCLICNTELSRHTVYEDALDHISSETGVIENRIEPDCVNDGSYDYVIYCKVCNEEISREIIQENAFGHNYTTVLTIVEPTCNEIGYTIQTYTCETCCYSYEEYVEIPVLGHDYVQHSAKTPTCTEIGWNAYNTCTRCDYSTYTELSAIGHLSAGAVIENNTQPTCEDFGQCDFVSYCKNCGLEISRDTVFIDPIGHTDGFVVESIVQPGCIDCGYHFRVLYCEICSCEISRTSEVIMPMGHNYEEGIVVKPGFYTEGYTEFNCTVCGHTENFNITSPLDCVVGDANGDHITNNIDLGLLIQYINGFDVIINEIASDLNFDGNINNRDYALLMQYVNGWEIELK